MRLHPTIQSVTDTIRERSIASRTAYLKHIDAAIKTGPVRKGMACSNLAHGFAAGVLVDKRRLSTTETPNLGIVTAYNDMLSAHQPFETYPEQIRKIARDCGATAQVAGGVPAMCDGVTQGRLGMELSLFSRDVIAQASAIALSHDMFDTTVYLGICDKIIPGMLIGALSAGHLPAVFIPAGPMPTGISNKEKAAVRERYAAGKATREELLQSESDAYHAPGTCTFYGTANSNQVLLEAMGAMLPGTAFVNPGTPLREAFTDAATRRALAITALGKDFRPLGRIIDERAIVNAIVALMATGGSTNHTIHWIAVARAAGITLTWDDMDQISHAVPLLSHVYPNGSADVNRFTACGGTAFVFRELMDAGLMHADLTTVSEHGMTAYGQEPRLNEEDHTIHYVDTATTSGDDTVVRPVSNPFEAHGGLQLLNGNLGRGLIKVSAVEPQFRQIEAPAVVLNDQHELNQRFADKNLPKDFVAVVRFQGPRANGMPELHSLAPILGLLQGQGRRVALVTDGRMSGASGKFPAAIHVTPEAARGGPLCRIREGDIVKLDGMAGTLEVLVDKKEWDARQPDALPAVNDYSVCRSLFAHNRHFALAADEGALSISCGPFADEEASKHEANNAKAEAAISHG